MQLSQPQLTLKLLDTAAMEKLIDDRVVAKLKDLKLLNQSSIAEVAPVHVEAKKNPEDHNFLIPDRFYPSEPITAMELYVRESVNLLKLESSFIDVAKIRNDWHRLGTGRQEYCRYRASEINRNYLSLDPPTGLTASEIKVPSLENAMERIFFDHHCPEFSSDIKNVFVTRAKDLKFRWDRTMTAEDKQTYVQAAKDLIARWQLASGGKTEFELFKQNYCARYGSTSEENLRAAFEELNGSSKAFEYVAESIKLNREKSFSKEDIPTSIGPNVAKKVSRIPKEEKKDKLSERNERILARKAENIYTHHYCRSVRHQGSTASYNDIVKITEKQWANLSLDAKAPYFEMAREDLARRDKRNQYYDTTSVPK